jgi:hypothetical protein
VLAVIAALIVLAGCLLPWYATGGGTDLPLRELRAFDGSGILSFLAALATLALVTLPYAAGDHPVGLDRPLAYGLILVVALAGIVLWFPSVIDGPLVGLLPDSAPGLWITAVGVMVLARAAFEMTHEPPRL